jgi:hypothetical protein
MPNFAGVEKFFAHKTFKSFPAASLLEKPVRRISVLQANEEICPAPLVINTPFHSKISLSAPLDPGKSEFKPASRNRFGAPTHPPRTIAPPALT